RARENRLRRALALRRAAPPRARDSPSRRSRRPPRRRRRRPSGSDSYGHVRAPRDTARAPCTAWGSPFFFEQSVDVLGRIERYQIVDALADADVANRQLEIVRDRHGDAALRRAIELREHDAVHACRAHELARLHDAVLAHG